MKQIVDCSKIMEREKSEREEGRSEMSAGTEYGCRLRYSSLVCLLVSYWLARLVAVCSLYCSTALPESQTPDAKRQTPDARRAFLFA